MAVEIRQHVAETLRLAAERVLRVQIGVVIDLDERLESNPQPLAVIKNAVMVIRDAPRSRIEIEPRVELAGLLETAELGVAVAAAQRPGAAAGAVVVFEDLHLVAGLA